MDILYEIVWVNGNATIESIHLENINIETLGTDLRKISSKFLKDELFRLELAEYKKQNSHRELKSTYSLAPKNFHRKRLEKPINEILAHPEIEPRKVIREICGHTQQTALNYIMEINRTIQDFKHFKKKATQWTFMDY